MKNPGRKIVSALASLAVLASLSSCGGGRKPTEFRLMTESFSMRVSANPAPPRALEQVSWTVTVSDRETGLPIDGGEGRIFASSRDGKNIANGFAPTEKVGTYTTKLFYVTAGTWAMGIQFRRDSTSVLERTDDWTQDVRTGEEPGEYELPQSTPVQPKSTDSDTTKLEEAAEPL